MSLFPLFFATWFSNPSGHHAASDYNAYNVQSKPFGLFQKPFFKSFDPFNHMDNMFHGNDMFHDNDMFRKPSFEFMDAWIPDTSMGQVKITTENGVYKLVVSVGKFKPEDVTVKVKGRNLVIRAQNDDDGVVSSVQSYSLPYNVNVNEIQSKIEKGILTVTAPLKKKLEKVVPITVKDKGKDKDEKQKEPEKQGNKEKEKDDNKNKEEKKKQPEK